MVQMLTVFSSCQFSTATSLCSRLWRSAKNLDRHKRSTSQQVNTATKTRHSS